MSDIGRGADVALTSKISLDPITIFPKFGWLVPMIIITYTTVSKSQFAGDIIDNLRVFVDSIGKTDFKAIYLLPKITADALCGQQISVGLFGTERSVQKVRKCAYCQTLSRNRTNLIFVITIKIPSTQIF